MIHWFKPPLKVRRRKRRSAINDTSHIANLLLFSVSRARGIEGQFPHQAITIAVMRTCTLRLRPADAFRSGGATRWNHSAPSDATGTRRRRRRTTTTTRVAATADRFTAASVRYNWRAFESGSTAPVVTRCRSRRSARSVPTLLNSHVLFLCFFFFFFYGFILLPSSSSLNENPNLIRSLCSLFLRWKPHFEKETTVATSNQRSGTFQNTHPATNLTSNKLKYTKGKFKSILKFWVLVSNDLVIIQKLKRRSGLIFCFWPSPVKSRKPNHQK